MRLAHPCLVPPPACLGERRRPEGPGGSGTCLRGCESVAGGGILGGAWWGVGGGAASHVGFRRCTVSMDLGPVGTLMGGVASLSLSSLRRGSSGTCRPPSVSGGSDRAPSMWLCSAFTPSPHPGAGSGGHVVTATSSSRECAQGRGAGVQGLPHPLRTDGPRLHRERSVAPHLRAVVPAMGAWGITALATGLLWLLWPISPWPC